VLSWGGLAWIAIGLLASDPPRAGFDLELVLRAGRDIAAGRSPYDPTIIAGAAPDAVRLFYSYPPAIGQAATLVGGLPLGVALAGLGIVAVAGLAAVVAGLRRYFVPWVPVVLSVAPAIVVAPLVLPFAIAVLFGNLDALFPFVYGAALLAALGAGRWPVVGGAAVAVAALGKVYPAGLGLWFLIRAVRDRQGLVGVGSASRKRVVFAAVATAAAVLMASLVVGGMQPWLDYATVARVVSGSEIVDHRNLGPAAQFALWLGGGDELARSLHAGVLVLAVGSIAWAAWMLDEPVVSLALAAAASLVLLPITWYHYAAALIPFAVASVLRDRSAPTVGLVAGAGVLAAAGLVAAPLLWLAGGLVVWAARTSGTVAAASGR
jgi:hypothetical protein